MGNVIKNPFRSSKGDEPDLDSSTGHSSKFASTGTRRAPSLQEVGGVAFTLDEAVELQTELRVEFAKPNFQALCKRIREQYPQHETKGHHDQASYTADLQKLMLSVYNTVLPREPWRLSPGWAGARQMRGRMETVVDHPRVKSIQDQIDACLLCDVSSIEDPLVLDTPDGSGAVPEFELQCVKDKHGDLAHEFWIMDRGSLRPSRDTVGPRTVVKAIFPSKGFVPKRKPGKPDTTEQPAPSQKTKEEKKDEKKSKKGKKSKKEKKEEASVDANSLD